MATNSSFNGPDPYLVSEGNPDLNPDSTLIELPLYNFTMDISHLGKNLARVFEKYPILPGAVLSENEQFIGAISRHQFLEYLLLPHGTELFLNNPLEILCSYNRCEILVLPSHTPILIAAQQAFKRQSQYCTEPVIVKTSPFVYKILDFGQLTLAAWQIRGIETQVRYERSQVQTIQSEKMASLGRLVDGIAHEILDPVGFIWGNLTHVSNYSHRLLELIRAYENILPTIPPEIVDLKAKLEINYLQEDLPQVVASITSGAQRLKHLAVSLQNFCHIDEVYPKPADIHACLDGIILLLKSRLGSEIKIIKNYGKLPPVTCYIGKISQVFMNILTNAADALLNESITQTFALEYHQPRPSKSRPKIEITTQIWLRPPTKEGQDDQRFVSIRIADNGPGMSIEQQRQIKESFSVEKRAAKETSLAVSYYIITAKHGGEFNLRSQPGIGTEFEILLPLA